MKVLLIVDVEKAPFNEVESDYWKPNAADVAETIGKRVIDWDFDDSYIIKTVEVLPMSDLKFDDEIERLCEVMHDAYEAAAAGLGWETQAASRKPWADVPEANKATMRVAVRAVHAAIFRDV